jgi:hypothetical protein
VGLSCSSFSVWNVSFGTATSPMVVSATGLLPDCGGDKLPTVGVALPDPPDWRILNMSNPRRNPCGKLEVRHTEVKA